MSFDAPSHDGHILHTLTSMLLIDALLLLFWMYEQHACCIDRATHPVDLVQQAVLQQVRHEVQGGQLSARLLQQRLGIRSDDVLHRVQLRSKHRT